MLGLPEKVVLHLTRLKAVLEIVIRAFVPTHDITYAKRKILTRCERLKLTILKPLFL